jgi:UDP-GlcNAc:undecaprenyl-phosphate GlcNAc-1-phosphate transferase
MNQAWQGLWNHSLVAAITAFLATILLVVTLKPVARALGWVDRPGGRKIHAVPTPLIGGLAIVLGALPAAVFTFEPTPRVVGFGLAALIVVATGIIDDLIDLRWPYRLLAQASAALVLVYVGDVRIERIGPMFGGEIDELGALSVPLTVIATVGIINALNMADGVDGLAGAMTVCALVMLTSAAVYSGNVRLSHGLVLLLGAVLAFLAFNMRTPWRPRAGVFLGDAGAEFLGLAIAWACFRLTQNDNHPVTPALAPFLVAPPVIDCLAVMLRRVSKGKSPFAADRNHLHHMMLDGGLRPSVVVAILSAVSLTIGLGAALALKAQAPDHALALGFLALLFTYYLASADRERCIAVFAWLARRIQGGEPAKPRSMMPAE